MRRFATFTLLGALVSLSGNATLNSPDGNIKVDVTTDSAGAPHYSVTYKGRTIIEPSALGILTEQGSLPATGLTIVPLEVTEFDETWTPVWGEYAAVRNHYNEQAFNLVKPGEEKPELTVRFRVFDDGVGFRYEIPEGKSYLTVTDELTEFRLPGDPTLIAIPGDYDTDERLYTTTLFSKLGDNLERPPHGEGSLIPGLAVQTPLMVTKVDGDVYLNIHEAALKGYPAMALDADTTSRTLKAHLTPDMNGVRAFLQAPFETPWRTLVISDDARDILASQLIYNLNEPSKIKDTSWIKPQKFIGVWWEMFTGGNSWAYADAPDAKPGITDYTKLKPNGHHPANTANVIKYIDFAAESGIPAVLVEGWNEGWEDWGGYKKNRQFLFDKPYPDFDVDSLQHYAASKGVKLIMHHETAGNAADYERQLDRAFQYMKDHGYDAVKTGYVGFIIPRSERHSSQWMVDHYNYIAQRAADYKIMVNSHEAVRPTGMARTWPNWLAQESARGGEHESMGVGNTPEHTTILPFTRLMGGPMDYTPGLFESDLSTYGKGNNRKGSTTLAKQLALYLTMPSPIQMASDLPENYRRFPDAFQFIKDVPVDWKDSKYLLAEPGDYIAVARLDKNSDDWYIGAITDENPRDMTLDLSFLPKGQKFEATIYEDAPDAKWGTNPKAYNIRTVQVNSKTKLKQHLAPGGGAAIRIVPLNK